MVSLASVWWRCSRYALNHGFRRDVTFMSTRLSSMWTTDVIQVSRDVADSLREGKPVVALESTIISHGMAYPANVEVAMSVEATVRSEGALPATVAILNGKIRVGLTAEEIDFLGSSAKAVKTSRRDLPYVLANGLNGGTTVSATMIVAHAVGIPIFVTGGIGGVHRMANDNVMDVSADLTELGRTPVAVVCAGIKSILDIPNSLQYLETQGVGVFSYGSTLDFPGFFTSKSGYLASYNLDSPQKAAQVIERMQQLKLQSGCVIAVPIPEENSIDHQLIGAAIDEALIKARQANISGKDLTPFLLKAINELTRGKSQEANAALIRNNAIVGSRVAVELTRLKQPNAVQPEPEMRLKSVRLAANPAPVVPAMTTVDSDSDSDSDDAPIVSNRPVVIGGSNVDFLVKILQDHVEVGEEYLLKKLIRKLFL